MARAIITKSKLIFIEENDEAFEDQSRQLIHQIVRQRMKNRTVMILTRNLDSIIDVDRVMVVDQGRVVEFAHPYKLLVQKEDDKTITNINGQFAKMVVRTGIQNAQNLFEICESTYYNRNDFMDNVKNTLSITDNRTGKSYEIDIKEGMLPATQLQQIKSMQGIPLRSFDPAYMNTVNCISRISFIDGDKGILEYRGIPIEQLASRSQHLEVAFLLIYGQPPTRE